MRGTSARPLFQRFPPPSRSHPTPLPRHLNSFGRPLGGFVFPRRGTFAVHTHNLNSRNTRMSPLGQYLVDSISIYTTLVSAGVVLS